MKLLLAVIVVIIGTLQPVQAGINAELRRQLGHPLLASLASFGVGFGALGIAILIVRLSFPALAQISAVPFWQWLGGLCGAILVFTSIIAAPRLGAVLFLGCLVAGQLGASVVIDHFGWIGYPLRSINAARIVGVLLLLAGVVLVQRGS